MRILILLTLLIALRVPTLAQSATEHCTFENARAWLTSPPADYELAFTHFWPGREAKFPPKNYYFVAYRGNYLLIKTTNAIPFDSQSTSNALPREGTMLGKNGSMFWVLNERNGTSEMLVWTNRLEPSEIHNEVMSTHRSSVESLKLLRGLGIQTIPAERLQWEGINFAYQAETNGAFLRGAGSFVSNQDRSLRNATYSYEKSNSPSEAVKRFAFDVKFSGAIASANFVLPRQFGVWSSLKGQKPYEIYAMRVSLFSTERTPASVGIFDFSKYITPDETKVFFVAGTNLLYQSSSGQIQAVIPDPNDPRIVRQKNTLQSRRLYFFSAALLACLPVAFIAIKLWRNKKKNQ